MTEPYVVVHADDVGVDVWRHDDGRDDVGYELRRDDVVLASMSAPRWYPPHVAVAGRRVTLWAGARLLVLDVDTRRTGTWEDEWGDVVAVLPVAGGWLVVTELTVSLRSADLAAERARYEHPEVMLAARLSGSAVVVRDFDGVEIVLDAATLERLR